MTSQRPSLTRLSSILIRPPTPPPPTASSLPSKLRSPVTTGSPPLSPDATPPPTPTNPPNYTSPGETFAAPTNTSTSFYSVPTSPTIEIEASSPSSPNSPIRKHVSITSPSETIYGKATSSGLMKLLSRPPSPLTLPPAQINTDDDREEQAEQKNVLVQETVDKPMKMLITHESGIASDGENESKKHNKHAKEKNYESEEWGMRVIPLVGKNEGAVMELSLSPKKNHSVGSLHSLNIDKTSHKRSFRGDQFSNKDRCEDDESKIKDKTNRITTIPSTPMRMYLNSNVQGANNSMLSNCTFKHNDPGVQISLRGKANGGH